MLKRKCFNRAKVNCLCRCTPTTGIECLSPKLIKHILRRCLALIDTQRSTGVIAATAVQTGRILEQTGHWVPAIMLYRTAIRRILNIDEARAEDYNENGPLPGNPYYRYWRERINDADALEVAQCLDRLYLRMNMPGEAHQQRRIRGFYERLFNSIYCA